jgi:hypothetical protein
VGAALGQGGTDVLRTVTVHDADNIPAVTFESGVLELAVRDLLADTSLGEHVIRRERDGMFGVGRSMIEYVPGPLPVAAWSTGEKGLWLFLASMSGHQPINLYGLAAQFKGTPEAGHISNLIHLLFIEGN